jgi:hypothetical protein
MTRVAEAAEFLNDVIAGKRPSYLLQEALSTSDFPLLMGDILDRQLLGNYTAFSPSWQNYCKRGRVRDFRTVRRIALDGLTGRFYPDYAKPELTAPKEDNSLTETGYTYAVQVYEKAAALNWKMIVNDDLDAFSDIPRRLAQGARYTEEYFATTLFVDANGPHASLYTAGNANIVTGNPALTIAGLQTAMTVLGAMKDSAGEPIVVDSVELVVPPALEVTALNILNATQLWLNTNAAAGTAEQNLVTANWMRNRVAVGERVRPDCGELGERQCELVPVCQPEHRAAGAGDRVPGRLRNAGPVPEGAEHDAGRWGGGSDHGRFRDERNPLQGDAHHRRDPAGPKGDGGLERFGRLGAWGAHTQVRPYRAAR